MCSATFWTLRRNSVGACDTLNYNIAIGAGRRWDNTENDEICDWTCANGGVYCAAQTTSLTLTLAHASLCSNY